MPLPPLVAPAEGLSPTERVRTSRHAVLSGFGDVGQRRLRAAHVAVVGAGGLGSPIVLALAAAGIGIITIIDDDTVEASNLQRQVMHRLEDVGAPKTASAVRVAAGLSPETEVRTVQRRIGETDADELLRAADVVVDGTDTFASRAIVAAACERLGVPLVWGVLQEFHAQVTVLWSAPPADVAAVTLADLYPPETVGDVPSCAEVGVLGALCMQVGGIMALEVVKLVAGIGEPLLGRIAVIDGLRGRQTEVPLRPSIDVVPYGPARPPVTSAAEKASVPTITATEMEIARARGARLLDVREPVETDSGVLEGSLLVPLSAVLTDPAAVGPGPFVVICQRGPRAERAALALRNAGIEASVLAGGIESLRMEEQH